MTSVIAGLTSVEASRRLAADGPNQLPEPRRPSALKQFGKQFTHLLAILLWVASGLALLAGQTALAVAIGGAGILMLWLAVAIVVVVVLNAYLFNASLRSLRSIALTVQLGDCAPCPRLAHAYA